MRRLHPAVYLGLALLVMTPVTLRAVAWWRAPRPQALDPALAEAGAKLFKHEWTPHDPLANGGDGLGPVYNANSCVACHSQGGVGGSGGVQHNVTTFVVRPTDPAGKPLEGVIHSHAINPQYLEVLGNVIPGQPANAVKVSQRNTPALFGAKLIDELPDEARPACEYLLRDLRLEVLLVVLKRGHLEDLDVVIDLFTHYRPVDPVGRVGLY